MRAIPLRFYRAIARRAASCGRSEDGETAIEFAFTVPMIVALLLAIFQIAVIFTAQSYLETVTEKAMREVLTNQAYSLTQAKFNAQVCADAPALFTCSNLVIQLEPATCPTGDTAAQCIASLTPQPDNNGNYTNPTTFNPGSPNVKMALIVLYPWPVVGGPLGLNFGSGGWNYHLLSSTQVFYVEPCTTSNNCVNPNG